VNGLTSLALASARTDGIHDPGVRVPEAILRRSPAAREAAREPFAGFSVFDMGELY
jgi:hypothetical protein